MEYTLRKYYNYRLKHYYIIINVKNFNLTKRCNSFKYVYPMKMCKIKIESEY